MVKDTGHSEFINEVQDEDVEEGDEEKDWSIL